MNNNTILKRFLIKVIMIILIMITISLVFSTLNNGKKIKESRPVKTMKIKTIKTYNFDGKYKNQYGAVIEIKGNKALLYASAEKGEISIEDDFIESILSNDGQTKTLRYRYIDDTGGYTIIICGKSLKVTYEKPEENDLIANQYKKF